MIFNRLFAFMFSAMVLSATATLESCAITTDINGCISFTVGQGTGCSWMCEYCANQLGTNNYYFMDGVCTYQTGGCVGSPVAGKTYTCCAEADLNFVTL